LLRERSSLHVIASIYDDMSLLPSFLQCTYSVAWGGFLVGLPSCRLSFNWRPKHQRNNNNPGNAYTQSVSEIRFGSKLNSFAARNYVCTYVVYLRACGVSLSLPRSMLAIICFCLCVCVCYVPSCNFELGISPGFSPWLGSLFREEKNKNMYPTCQS